MQFARLRWAATTMAIALLATTLAACDDFYSDSPPLSTGPTATRSADEPSDPAAAVDSAARSALSGRLGVDPELPRLVGVTGTTWTASNPGCFPFEPGLDTAQLVPGVSVEYEYAGLTYRFDSDQTGLVGALCDSTRRDVTVSAAGTLFDGTPFMPPAPVILRTREDAAAYVSENRGASFDTDAVDWEVESLGAIVLNLPGAGMEPLVRGARLSDDGLTVIVEVAVADPGSTNPGEFPLWVFLEDIEDAEQLVAEITVVNSPVPTPTPPPFANR